MLPRPGAGEKAMDLWLLLSLPDLAIPTVDGRDFPLIGQEADCIATTTPTGRMQVPVPPIATQISPVGCSPANTRPTIARARGWLTDAGRTVRRLQVEGGASSFYDAATPGMGVLQLHK